MSAGIEALQDFEVAEENPYSKDTLLRSIGHISSMRDHLDEDMVNTLSACIPVADEQDLDLSNLIQSQLRSAVYLKNSYFNAKTGKLLDSSSAREAKDALASVQSIINVLIKQQESLDRQSRLFKMENVLMHCVQDLPEEAKTKFLDEVARQLGET